MHKLSVIEKLRERINDDDKLVRETLYQLLKAVVFPGCKEENQGPFISLMMAYIFNAMTHMAIDVRLMAFKFFDLVLQFYPASFSLYAEKILQNYRDILQKNQFYLQDRGKLKSTLAGLACCLSLLPCNKRDDDFAIENVVADRRILHAFELDVPKDSAGISIITKELKDLLPILISCFQDFVPLVQIMPQLDAQSFDCVLSILQSIDLVVKFFVQEIDKSGVELQVTLSPHAKPDVKDQLVLPVLLKKLLDVFPLNPTHQLSEKDDGRYFILNVIVSEIFLCLNDGISHPSSLLEKFLGFIGSALSEEMRISSPSEKAFRQKHSLSLIPFIPKLVLQVEGSWKSHILQAFTWIFRNCNPASAMKLACLSAIEQMLVPKQGCMHLHASDPEILEVQLAWIRELPLLLIHLDDKNPVSSRAVLRLQLSLGQCALMNPSLSHEYDNMQFSMSEFYSKHLDGEVYYGPFIKLSRDIQELSLSCIYYFSFLDPLLLQSLVSCCLSHDLEPFMLFRLLEILHSVFKGGHIQIGDYISFLITLLLRYRVSPEKSSVTLEKDGKSNGGTFKHLSSVVCSRLSQIGDTCLVFQMLEKVVIDQISGKLPLENVCGLLRMLTTLDSRPTKLSEWSIIKLGDVLPEYLIGVVSCIPEEVSKSTIIIRTSRSRDYLLPCLLLFYRSNKLLNLVLNSMGSLVSENRSTLSDQYATDHSSRIKAIVSVILLIHADARMQQILPSCKAEIDLILQNIQGLQSSEGCSWTIEGRHKIQCAYDTLKGLSSK